MKTSELTGAALDWAVAKCEGKKQGYEHNLLHIDDLHLVSGVAHSMVQRYSPSTIWSQGGPIIERECIDVMFEGPEWYAYMRWESGRTLQYDGETPLIAAMRCYVASKLGDEVDVPEELK